MKIIESALTPTEGYINSFIRNTVEGWWELEVGLPKTWVFDENSKIGCELIFENELGKLIKVFPKKNNIVIDDLITFVEIIIQTNEKITVKEKEFTNSMQEMKSLLEEKAKQFYEELDELKENSFKNLNNTFANTLNEKSKVIISEKPKPSRKPRVSRNKKETTTQKKIATVTEETETIDSDKK
jgi:hypothetical protein